MKLSYRPEIDGLRAIAVVAVILYHAQINIFGYQPFKGGFIGVDIFFVISGYLITSIILKELLTTGTFSFKHFYERRVRRILPALLFVMLVSLPFAWMYLLPLSFIDFSKSILYSLGFSSNFYFYYSGQQYGAESGLLKPFLHTWSLSVEEQFYILFPIVLLITFKYFRKYIVHILILEFFVSLVLAEWTSRNYASASFYFLPSRMWELLSGSILAYFEIKLGNRSKNKTLNLIFPTIGLILIGHSILFFNDGIFHPSIYTLSPVIGVCLIIWFSSKNELITKILSTKLFVGIGLISYSLYLWHYPLFSYTRYLDLYSNSYIPLLLLTTFTLSVFSYFFIEKPFRKKKNKSFFIFLIATTFLIMTAIIITLFIKNDEKKKIDYPADNIVHSRDLLFDNLGNSCFNNDCQFQSDEKFKKIYLIGDSIMASLSYDLVRRLNKKFNIRTSTYSGCLFFPGFDLIENNKNINENCNNKYFTNLENELINNEGSIIIILARYPLIFSGEDFDNKEGGLEQNNFFKSKTFKSSIEISKESSFINTINKLQNKNKIIIIYPVPEVGFNVPKKLLIKKELKKNITKEFSDLSTSFNVFIERNAETFNILDKIQGKNIIRIFPHHIFCKYETGRCITHKNNIPYYSDDNHPSLQGSILINDLIMKEIEKIELSNN